jgi:hypothetical protein
MRCTSLNSRFAAALVTLGLMAACKDPGGGAAAANPSVPAPGASTPAESPPAAHVPTTAGPHLEFERTEHHFGTVSDTRKHSTSFAFTNTGGATLVISDVKAACGCTVPVLRKKVYQPGETGTIDVTFDPTGKEGETPKYITVISNSEPEESIKLLLTSDIRPLVSFERMVKLGDIPLGKGLTVELPVRYFDPELKLSKLEVNNPHLTARIAEMGIAETADGATEYRGRIDIDVSPQTPWGLIYATRLTMTASARPGPDEPPMTKEYTAFLTGEVYGVIRCNVSILSVGQVAPQPPFERSVILERPDGQPFAVTATSVIETEMPGLSSAAKPITPSKVQVVLTGNPGSFRGHFKGAIEITTDVPGEEKLLVRFAGQVK